MYYAMTTRKQKYAVKMVTLLPDEKVRMLLGKFISDELCTMYVHL